MESKVLVQTIVKVENIFQLLNKKKSYLYIEQEALN